MFINRSPWRLIDKYYVMINYVMVLLGNTVIHTSRVRCATYIGQRTYIGQSKDNSLVRVFATSAIVPSTGKLKPLMT